MGDLFAPCYILNPLDTKKMHFIEFIAPKLIDSDRLIPYKKVLSHKVGLASGSN